MHAAARDMAKVLKAAAEAVTEAFDAAPGDQTWQLAGVEFTEQGRRRTHTAPPVLAPLVRRLIETAPSWCPTPQLPETLRRLALDSALDDVEAILEQELSDTPGARALLDLIPHITPAGRRTRHWAAAARRQDPPFGQCFISRRRAGRSMSGGGSWASRAPRCGPSAGAQLPRPTGAR